MYRALCGYREFYPQSPGLGSRLRICAPVVRFGFYSHFLAAAIDSLSAAVMSASSVITCAGFGLCDSRPSNTLTSSRSSHGKLVLATHRHSFTGPAMRRRHRNTKIARNRRPAFERRRRQPTLFCWKTSFWQASVSRLFIARAKDYWSQSERSREPLFPGWAAIHRPPIRYPAPVPITRSRAIIGSPDLSVPSPLPGSSQIGVHLQGVIPGHPRFA